MLAAISVGVGVGVAHACLRLAVAAAPLEVPCLGEAGRRDRSGSGRRSRRGQRDRLRPPLAWRATRTVPSAALKADARAGSDRSWHRLGDLLVGAQVALTVVLLVAGGLLLASFVRVMQVERGFEPASVIAVDLNLPASRYDPGRRTQLYTTASSRG